MTPKEQLSKLTTKQIAIDLFNIVSNGKYNMNDLVHYFNRIEEALSELEELKKRDTPTTPFHITSTYEGRVGNCPHCNKLVDELTVDAFNRPLHICGCGQKLDWKEK